MFNIASKITFSRILISFVATILIFTKDIDLLIIAIILIAITELTDILDGYIARREDCVTQFGKLLDPLSDSISRFLYFFAFAYSGMFPFWLVIFLFIRDIIVAYIRTYMSLLGVAMSARSSGKFKAFVQSVGQYLLLFILLILLLNKGFSYSETYLLYAILFGTIIGLFIFYSLRVSGKYLIYSLVGYSFFALPLYFVNKLDIVINTQLPVYIMSFVVIVTLYSLIDYIYAFIIEFKSKSKIE
jgi:CDP-diacylglycerol--glycerol-3-phosphate 3-phosphatidyltransferase